MTKDEFIAMKTTDKYSAYDREVVSFIAEILYDGRNNNDTVRSFFREGYCYYFATMLKEAFNRGKLCVTEPFGHIVWVDVDGLAYDIEGPYRPEEQECQRLTNIEFFGDLKYDFMHIPGKEYHAPGDFHDWARFMRMSDTYAVTRIYIDMPKEHINYEIDNVEQVVYLYWLQHQRELQEEYWHLRKSKEATE